jgi:sporulation protein YlmC with PRC-barrel domain
MGTRFANELLQLPVRHHGIRLGRPVDLLLDSAEWRALGFVVRCGDESLRFLVFTAADALEDALAVPSAFLLLEGLDFYRERSRSFHGLLGEIVEEDGRELGELRDLRLGPDGTVEALVVEADEGVRGIHPTGATVEARRVSTA